MTKLRVAFRNFANAPKEDLKTSSQYKEVKATLPNISRPSKHAFQLLLLVASQSLQGTEETEKQPSSNCGYAYKRSDPECTAVHIPKHGVITVMYAPCYPNIILFESV